jgi:hypothetical protein
MGIAGYLVDHLPNQHPEGYHHPDMVPLHQEKDIGQYGYKRK